MTLESAIEMQMKPVLKKDTLQGGFKDEVVKQEEEEEEESEEVLEYALESDIDVIFCLSFL